MFASASFSLQIWERTLSSYHASPNFTGQSQLLLPLYSQQSKAVLSIPATPGRSQGKQPRQSTQYPSCCFKIQLCALFASHLRVALQVIHSHWQLTPHPFSLSKSGSQLLVSRINMWPYEELKIQRWELPGLILKPTPTIITRNHLTETGHDKPRKRDRWKFVCIPYKTRNRI